MPTIMNINDHYEAAEAWLADLDPGRIAPNRAEAKKAKELRPSVMVYRPEKPLSCGAFVWIETHGDVLVDGEQI